MNKLETYTALVRERVGADNGVVKKNIKIDFTDITGVIVIEGRVKPNRVHNEDIEADLTIRLQTRHFEQLMSKEVAGPLLLMQGKMRLRGSIGLAMKMDDILKINKVPPARF